MSSDVTRIMNQARVRQYTKEDQEDLAQETWLQSLVQNTTDPRYMTQVIKSSSAKMFIKKQIAERNINNVTLVYYSNDNSMQHNHLKEDIKKCYTYLNDTQKRIFEEMKSNPEATQVEWSKNLNIARRTLAYHLLNIRAVFKSLLEDNEQPVYSAGYLKDRRYNG